jgi:serine/threonine protein kinase
VRPLAVVTEFMSRGSLYAVLHDKTLVLTDGMRVQFLNSIAQGMAYLHSQGIVHRDLKSHNVLVNSTWQ